MKQLIINADDLGADMARNDGIFEAIKAGAVTAVSILANGPAFSDAVQRLKSLEITVSCGIHVNLSEGRPLSSPLSILTGPDGCFRGKAFVHELLRNEGQAGVHMDIRQEVHAQIRALQSAGIKISHLDGHQHVHIFPAALQVVAEVAEESGIPWIRLPEEPPPEGLCEKDKRLDAEADNFSRLAGDGRDRLSRFRISVTDHFRGLYLKNRLNPMGLQKVIESIPEGLTELMVHPGRIPETTSRNPFSSFSVLEREIELKALLSPEFIAALAAKGVNLVRFPEIKP